MQNRSVWFFSVAILVFAPVVCHAQEATSTPSPNETEVESVVVSATRFDIPLDQSPASASVEAGPPTTSGDSTGRLAKLV